MDKEGERTVGRTAMVTGGTRGIGEAISVALKQAGYTVAASYAGNDEAANRFKDATGIPVYKFDVGDFDACAAAVKQIEEDVGPIAVLVNNAGITRDKPLHKRLGRAATGNWIRTRLGRPVFLAPTSRLATRRRAPDRSPGFQGFANLRLSLTGINSQPVSPDNMRKDNHRTKGYMGKHGANRNPEAPLIRALLNPAAYDHPAEGVRVMETHISWVLLTGAFAYKIKKPVSLGFADFSTLEQRRTACDEEVRLNMRLASRIYLGVVPICGSVDAPVVNGAGDVIEYAVKMRQFPDDARLDGVVERGGLSEAGVRELAATVAGFHSKIAVAGPEAHAQQSERRYRDVMDNFEALDELPEDPGRAETIEKLRSWSADSLAVNADRLRKRKRDGFVRECHGDMHLANMALFEDRILIFDALEFNEALRWTDVMSEVAFVVMDFVRHARPDLASVFLSSYLEATGDYDALVLLRHFLVYRAMVRAKVSAIRASQQDPTAEAREEALRETEAFLALARRCTHYGARPFVLITCGVSGSGKSLLSGQLVGRLGAIRVRSDVERQRRAQPGEDLYSGFARHRTYGRLEGCADKVLSAGLPVIVDATFLTKQYRQRFWNLANEHGVPFGILALKAPRDVLVSRVESRQAEGKDPSEATVSVLDRQLEEMEPLTASEREFTVEIESVPGADLKPVERFLRRAERLPLNHRMRKYGVLPGEFQ